MKNSYSLKSKICLSLVLILAAVTSSFAQEPAWKVTLDKGVEWTRYTPNKILLIGSSDWGLHGVDATNGKLLWSNEDLYNSAKAIKGADGKNQKYTEALIQVLTDDSDPKVSDFAVIKYTDWVSVKNFVVLNLRTGEVVTSPAKAGFPTQKVLTSLKAMGSETATFNYEGSAYIPELKAVMVSGTWIDIKAQGTPSYQLTKLIDLESGKELWANDQVNANFEPLITEDGNLFLLGDNIASKVDAKTGKVLWSYAVAEKKNTFQSFGANLNVTDGYIYQKKGSNGLLTALDLNSGNVKWEKELSSKDAPMLSAEHYGVIAADEKNFTLFDSESGEVKWTAKKLDGVVVDMGGEHGIAVGEKGKYLTVLDKHTGEEKWSEKIKGIEIDQLTGAGIMYRNEDGSIGLFDFDGKPIWDGKNMIKGETVLRAKPSMIEEIFYANGKIYNVDLITGEKRVIIDDIKFKEKETPDQLEYTGTNFVLSSSQNMLGFDDSGRVLYQGHWPSPKISLAGRIALRTVQVAALAMTVASSAAAGANHNTYSNVSYNKYGEDYKRQADFYSGIADGMAAAAGKRFKATISRGTNSFILTDVGDGNGLVRVDKVSGKSTGEIKLNDKEPTFDSDPENGMIFYKPSKKEVHGYVF
ncbi:PQQ-binding-like beta-propeller repeat protein [Algoriphagus aquimarinus]|uniref:outer membrane protein assembly factor BamB family protein n=1 Tax=Algoriphagus aquimarinus TaxID=237018 RepID=UPI0030DAF9B5|tara:strand:+ start:90196 stop:92115 length:1920 start_codon:yes stop_codon:yes gene_type:complete